MLSEAFRVLQPKGVVGFSVWGEKEASTYFGLVPSVVASLNLESPEESQKRSNFHLNSRDKLIGMLE